MAATTKICWMVPKSMWESYKERIIREKGDTTPYLRVEVEQAIEQWLDIDPLRETEELIEKYAQNQPDVRSGFSDLQYSINGDGDDLHPVRLRLRSDLVDRFRKVVNEETDHANRYGIPLGKALHFHHIGGRLERINDRLRQLVDMVTESSDGPEVYDPDEMGIHYNAVDLTKLDGRSRKKKRYEICQHLDPADGVELHRSDIEGAIKSVASTSTPEAYFDEVIDTLGFTTHPCVSKLYVSEERAEEIKENRGLTEADNHDIDQAYRTADSGAFDDLSREEKLLKIRIELARRAQKNNSRLYTRDYNFIRNQVFDRQTSAGYANNAMDDVADGEGFSLDTQEGKKRLKVDLENIGIELRKVLTSNESDSNDSDTESDSSDDEPASNEDDTESIETDADREMSRLTDEAAYGDRAMTDGGENMESGN